MSSAPKIEIVFEDEALLAVNKPAGLPVHVTLDPSRPHLQGILEKQIGRPLVLFHRLDLETTGLVLLGKKAVVNRAMTEMFMERKIKKSYWAVVEGRWLHEWHEVKTLIAKGSGGSWQNVRKGGQESHTRFRILKSSGERTWIEAQPLTGRTHQIRLHCLHQGHPICGDRRYGKAHPLGVPMALHAKKLTFPHPLSGEKISLEANAPDYWQEHWLKGLQK